MLFSYPPQSIVFASCNPRKLSVCANRLNILICIGILCLHSLRLYRPIRWFAQGQIFFFFAPEASLKSLKIQYSGFPCYDSQQSLKVWDTIFTCGTSWFRTYWLVLKWLIGQEALFSTVKPCLKSRKVQLRTYWF